MKTNIQFFTLMCGRLNRHISGTSLLEIEPVQVNPKQQDVMIVDLENGNRRLAKDVTFMADGAYARFESLMDFDLFQSALETHGFKKAFDFGD